MIDTQRNMPLVSIVTTTYHDADNLSRIIEQVKKQDYPNLEYIVVNGGSDQETRDVLYTAKDYFKERIFIIEEQDNGLYNALNKGLRRATGDIVGCLFDEYACANAITKMVTKIQEEKTDGIHADLYYIKGETIVRKWHQGQGNIRSGWMPGHPTLYLRRKVYEEYGYYKEDYKIAADYEFMVRILKDRQVTLSYLPEVLIHMAYGGTSNKSLGAYLLSLKEGHRALKENKVPFAFVTDICRTLRVLLQFRTSGGGTV